MQPMNHSAAKAITAVVLTVVLSTDTLSLSSIPALADETPRGTPSPITTETAHQPAAASDPVAVLESVPWDRDQVAILFEQAGAANSCQLIAPHCETFPEPTSAANASATDARRVSAFSVALTMTQAVRKSLPKLSKKRIESYLTDHALIVQPQLTHDERCGIVLGQHLKAAFISTKTPARTRKPDPMIAAAVEDFRVLGMFAAAGDNTISARQRTLLLAFRYVASGEVAVHAGRDSVDEFELIFLHLPANPDFENPEVAIFSTSHGRTRFHALGSSAPEKLVTAPTILSTVRFDHFKYFGLYPTQPVVTGITLQTQFSLPVETIQTRLGESDPSTSAVALCQLLDDLQQQARTANSRISADGR